MVNENVALDKASSMVSLFQDLPYSNISEQWKVFVHGANTGVNEHAPSERHYKINVDDALKQSLKKLGLLHGFGLEYLFLASLHYLIQGKTDSDESIVLAYKFEATDTSGVRDVKISASYCYTDEEVTISGSLKELSGFMSNSDTLNLPLSEVGLAITKELPPIAFGSLGYQQVEKRLKLAHFTVNYVGVGNDGDYEIYLDVASPELYRVSAGEFCEDYLKILRGLVTCDNVKMLSDVFKIKHDFISDELSDIQLKLRSIWGEILKVSKNEIKLDSCYFVLGGTSLNAFLLLNKVRSEFNVDLNIRIIAENSTLQAFSEQILRAQNKG